jgi:hypothetical protein
MQSLLTASCGGLPNVRLARPVQFAGIGQPRHCTNFDTRPECRAFH